MAIKRLFVANRGEIAVRINHAAKALGLTTIQAHSEADGCEDKWKRCKQTWQGAKPVALGSHIESLRT